MLLKKKKSPVFFFKFLIFEKIFFCFLEKTLKKEKILFLIFNVLCLLLIKLNFLFKNSFSKLFFKLLKELKEIKIFILFF